MSIHQRIREGRKQLEMTEQAFADAVGVTRGAVQQWEKEGGTAPRRKNQPSVAKLLGMSVADLMGEGGAMVASMTDSAVPGIRVPVLANSASMGPGDAVHSEDVVTGSLTLSPQWISDTLRPSRTEALRFIHAYGDSMAPTFNSGDVLLVDTGVAEARIDGIYVLGAHQRLFIKRVRQRMDGGYEVSSDNPAHKTVDALNGDQAVRVLGRVLWAWNGKKV